MLIFANFKIDKFLDELLTSIGSIGNIKKYFGYSNIEYVI